MATKLNTQCPNCHRWFTNQKSFRHHIRACRRAINANTALASSTILANPLLSVRKTSMSGQLSTFASETNDVLPLEGVLGNDFDFVNNHSEDHVGGNNQHDDDIVFMPSNEKQISNNSLDVMLHDDIQLVQ